ncbi:MAG: hypothetical protein LKCHEGNO_01427 [Burkholderiaceae bacterium]|nr:hypothetical protein [Burkholderiaceae bacterium]
MYLLDTQLVLWLAFEPLRLPARTSRLLADRATPAAFSLVSLWEVAVKTSLGRPDFLVDARELREGLLDQGFSELGIRAEHLYRVAALPWIHRDPFDRLLVAQAMEEGLVLLSADRTLKRYGKAVRVA